MTETDDEALAATVIGGPTVHDDTIVLVEHDPAWATLFAREAERIRAVLGPAALDVRARRLDQPSPGWRPSRSSTSS